MKEITKNLWAPMTTGHRKNWIIYDCIHSTLRQAKASYLKNMPIHMHKKLLERVKFVRVTVIEQDIAKAAMKGQL